MWVAAGLLILSSLPHAAATPRTDCVVAHVLGIHAENPTRIDADFIEALEEEYVSVGRTFATQVTTERYRELERILLATEYFSFPPTIRQWVDEIRRVNHIPVFRAVAGRWHAPLYQRPYRSPEQLNAMRGEWREEGASEEEIRTHIAHNLRPLAVSTSLSLAAALDTAYAYQGLSGHDSISVAVIEWDGRTLRPPGRAGFFGVDPLEIVLATEGLEPVYNFDISRYALGNMHRNPQLRRTLNRRRHSIPFLIRQLEGIDPRNQLHLPQMGRRHRPWLGEGLF